MSTGIAALSGNCGRNAFWQLYEYNRTLIISGKGSTFNFENDIAPWHKYRDMIEKVIVEEGITNIGIGYFLYHKNLFSVSLPNSLKQIKASAFSGCQNLKNIHIPENVSEIQVCALEECENLVSVVIDSDAINIGKYAFANCDKLSDIRLTKNAAIDESAFQNCENLKI